MNIGILDYGAGNLRSVQNALDRLGAAHFTSADPQQLTRADKIIFPGVGHAAAAMAQLRARRLDEFLRATTQPVLGICLGMQLLFSHSAEDDTACLGIIAGEVVKFDAATVGRVPHVGWNNIVPRTPVCGECATPTTDKFVYFVHSYYAPVGATTTQICDYNGQQFSAAVQLRNFVGMQFHPEKSSIVGQQILQDFLNNQ